VPSAAPAGRGEDQPGQDRPAENADNGERGIQVGDVKGGGWVAQPPDKCHGNEQKNSSERKLISGSCQWYPRIRGCTHHHLLLPKRRSAQRARRSPGMYPQPTCPPGRTSTGAEWPDPWARVARGSAPSSPSYAPISTLLWAFADQRKGTSRGPAAVKIRASLTGTGAGPRQRHHPLSVNRGLPTRPLSA
jgi:hypothetical protein